MLQRRFVHGQAVRRGPCSLERAAHSIRALLNDTVSTLATRHCWIIQPWAEPAAWPRPCLQSTSIPHDDAASLEQAQRSLEALAGIAPPAEQPAAAAAAAAEPAAELEEREAAWAQGPEPTAASAAAAPGAKADKKASKKRRKEGEATKSGGGDAPEPSGEEGGGKKKRKKKPVEGGGLPPDAKSREGTALVRL